MTKKIIHVLDVLSQDFDNGGETSKREEGNYIIEYAYTKNSKMYKSGVIFNRYKYISYTSEPFMDLYQINDTYDSIVEVGDSELLQHVV